jgi:hypothetical protein
MTRKKAAAKPPARKKPTTKAKPGGGKSKAATVFVVVREAGHDTPAYTEPERVFASRAAAASYARERNRELRHLVNPFDGPGPDYAVKGGEKALLALVKKLGLPAPKKTTSYGSPYIDWEEWWDRRYFDMTDAQRDAVWDALGKYNWYKVKATSLE